MQISITDIGEVILGHSFREAVKNDSNGNYFILQAKNIDRDGKVETEDLPTTFLESTKRKALVQDRDVILSNRGTFRAGVLYGNQKNILAASSLYIIRMHERERYLPEFLAIFLNSQAGQALLEGMNRGTLIKSLPKGSLLELPVPIPPLSTQQTVIDIHRNYSARSNLYERKIRIEERITNKTISTIISQ